MSFSRLCCVTEAEEKVFFVFLLAAGIDVRENLIMSNEREAKLLQFRQVETNSVNKQGAKLHGIIAQSQYVNACRSSAPRALSC